MTGPQYVVRCMGFSCGRIDAAQAAEMFVRNDTGRTGDLEAGFSYWVPGEGLKQLARVDVEPVEASQ